ncbi:MAG: HAD family hydrolase [Lachnospiraceae bacterium]|nr:HAD family hydrolase [uncultured Acetatifactor sp.]MCI8287089.1 HAD family hydrolase [Lachnospiraceae bacterium]
MKAVVFDMDGVLFDTELVCMKAWVAIAEKWGLPRMEEIFPLCIGLNANDSKRIVLDAYGEDFDYPGFRQETSDWFQEYIRERGLPIKPGVRQILEWLATTGYPVGLASSTKRSSVLSHLRQAGFEEYFSTVVGGDMVEHSKPQPDIYLLACRELGVRPEEAYAIEDSPNGIRAAYRAGMHPIMVPDMIAPDEEMRRLSRAIFGNLEEVRRYLAEADLDAGRSCIV